MIHPLNTHFRSHLTPHVLGLLRGRGWFSAEQCTLTVYNGAPEVGVPQCEGVREQLDQYVADGLLERADNLAACPLYRYPGDAQAHIERTHGDNGLRFLDAICIKVSKLQLDRLIPRDIDPATFRADGRPANAPSHDTWKRLADCADISAR